MYLILRARVTLTASRNVLGSLDMGMELVKAIYVSLSVRSGILEGSGPQQ